MIQRFELAVLLVLACCLAHVLVPPANAQSPVTVIGPAPTPGNCVQWFSTTQIKDPGITCNGGAGSSPGGSNGQVQYNNAGVFGGLTNTQLTADINLATASLSGALPAWPNNTTTFFRGDGSYASPSSGSYTPPGTGGSATTIQNRLNRVIYANDYGAVCNGSTDDSTAFQNAINEAQTLGVPFRWVGNCAISTGLNVTTSLDFGGTGQVSSAFTGIVSSLTAKTNGMTLITVNTLGSINFHDFYLDAGSTTGSTTGITLTAPSSFNAGSVFRNISVNGFSTCFNTGAAGVWIIDGSWFTNCSNIGILVQNTFNVDDGDSTITNSFITGSSVAQIQQVSAGGLRINNNKLNNGNGSGAGIILNLTSSANTSDLFIVGNSIEGSQFAIELGRQSGAVFSNVIISNNEFSSGGTSGSCVVSPSDTQWLTQVIVSNNVCVGLASGPNVAFQFATPVPSLNIINNSVLGQGSTNFAISLNSQTATDCTVGMITKRGTFNASSVSSCTVVGTD